MFSWKVQLKKRRIKDRGKGVFKSKLKCIQTEDMRKKLYLNSGESITCVDSTVTIKSSLSTLYKTVSKFPSIWTLISTDSNSPKQADTSPTLTT
jgi:hypothetical protein